MCGETAMQVAMGTGMASQGGLGMAAANGPSKLLRIKSLEAR